MPPQIKCLCFHIGMKILNQLKLQFNKTRHGNIKMIAVKVTGALRMLNSIAAEVRLPNKLTDLHAHLSTLCHACTSCLYWLAETLNVMVTLRLQYSLVVGSYLQDGNYYFMTITWKSKFVHNSQRFPARWTAFQSAPTLAKVQSVRLFSWMLWTEVISGANRHLLFTHARS